MKFTQQILDRSIGDDLAVINDGDIAAEALGLLKIMRRENNGRAGCIDLAQKSYIERRISISTPAVGSSRINTLGW